MIDLIAETYLCDFFGMFLYKDLKELNLEKVLQVLKKADMIRKNAVESILAERDILISVRNPFVVRST